MEHRNRVAALDGLRGWAALSVVGFHFYIETFSHVLPRPVIFVLSTVFNGPVAVAVFFVLSGYVLTVGSWRAPDKTAALRLVVKRHARLAIPILAATVVVALLLATHLTFNSEAARIVHREDWLDAWLHFSPDLGSMLAYAFGTVFLPAPSADYLPFLWTMTIELWLSYVVLLLCILERALRRPYLILLAVTVFSLLHRHPVVACFPLGALLALAQRDGYLKIVLPFRSAMAVVVFVLLAAALIRTRTYDERSTILIGTILVSVVLLSPDLTRLLSTPLSQALGRLSFPMYLAQFPVLVSLTSGLIVLAGSPELPEATLIGLASIAATLVLAVLLLPAEWLAQWIGRHIGRLVSRPAALTPSSPSAPPRPAANR